MCRLDTGYRCPVIRNGHCRGHVGVQDNPSSVINEGDLSAWQKIKRAVREHVTVNKESSRQHNRRTSGAYADAQSCDAQKSWEISDINVI